jgi:hypothetical protein
VTASSTARRAGEGVESFISNGGGAVAEAAEEGSDLGGALAHDDRLRAVGGAQRLDEPDEGGMTSESTE